MSGRVTEIHQGCLPVVGCAVGEDRRGLGSRTAAASRASSGEAQLHVRLSVSPLHFVFSFLQHRSLQVRISVVTEKLSPTVGKTGNTRHALPRIG